MRNLTDMTPEELLEWEKQQYDSDEIYRIAARVKNLARVKGTAHLTPVGESLCNVYTHVLKAFYDFANSLKDEGEKQKLITLIRQQEGMPGNLISSQVGTRGKKT